MCVEIHDTDEQDSAWSVTLAYHHYYFPRVRKEASERTRMLECVIYSPGVVMCQVRAQERIEETKQMLFIL